MTLWAEIMLFVASNQQMSHQLDHMSVFPIPHYNNHLYSSSFLYESTCTPCKLFTNHHDNLHVYIHCVHTWQKNFCDDVHYAYIMCITHKHNVMYSHRHTHTYTHTHTCTHVKTSSAMSTHL